LGAALAAAALGYKKWRQRRQGRQTGYSNRPDLVPPARRFLRLLKRCGAPCPRQLPWRDHLDALCRGGATGDCPQLDIAQALAFVHRYNQARFGAPLAHDIRQLEQMLGELEAGRRAGKAKRPRRLLATRSE
jgi:hypothetical protein